MVLVTSVLFHDTLYLHNIKFQNTVDQQILAAIKFGVSQNKVIWRLLNLASSRGPSMLCTIDVYVGGDKY